MRGHGLETGKKLDNLGKADLTQAGVLMDGGCGEPPSDGMRTPSSRQVA
jgi:hypothetical protein